MTNYASLCKDNLGEASFMRCAIREAQKAATKGEVPVGAIAVVGDKIVARAHNIREKTANPLGHAEILLLQKLARKKSAWRLSDVTVFVTCEPCIMCMGAMLQARIKKIVYGCVDPKAGKRLDHRVEVKGGVLADECSALLKDFFKGLRKR